MMASEAVINSSLLISFNNAEAVIVKEKRHTVNTTISKAFRFITLLLSYDLIVG
jgi:uncharacterized protein YutD